MLAPGTAVSQRLTESVVVGTSGLPTVLWSITNIRGTDTTITIRNGTLVSDTVVWGPNTGSTSAHQTYTFPNGLFCPNGVFMELGGTNPQVACTFTQRRT